MNIGRSIVYALINELSFLLNPAMGRWYGVDKGVYSSSGIMVAPHMSYSELFSGIPEIYNKVKEQVKELRKRNVFDDQTILKFLDLVETSDLFELIESQKASGDTVAWFRNARYFSPGRIRVPGCKKKFNSRDVEREKPTGDIGSPYEGHCCAYNKGKKDITVPEKTSFS